MTRIQPRSGVPTGTVAIPTTERDFMDQVVDLARVLGWRVAHFRPAQTARGWRTPVAADGAGFPDLILVRGSRAIAAELKREYGGRVSRDQQRWLDDLRDAGLEAYLWRPSDFDRIAQLLQERDRPAEETAA